LPRSFRWRAGAVNLRIRNNDRRKPSSLDRPGAEGIHLACDAASLRKAFWLRSLSIDNGLFWTLRRWTRFVVRLGMGMSRKLFSPAPADRRLPVRSGA
jgi:hypothetical protein